MRLKRRGGQGYREFRKQANKILTCFIFAMTSLISDSDCSVGNRALMYSIELKSGWSMGSLLGIRSLMATCNAGGSVKERRGACSRSSSWHRRCRCLGGCHARLGGAAGGKDYSLDAGSSSSSSCFLCVRFRLAASPMQVPVRWSFVYFAFWLSRQAGRTEGTCLDRRPGTRSE